MKKSLFLYTLSRTYIKLVTFKLKSMKNSMKIIFGLFIISLACSSCKKDEEEIETKTCIEIKIDELKNEQVQNPPAKIWEWKADSKTYYYVTSGCCDQFNFLYDHNCNKVCAPDGGFSGNGDGNCPEFNSEIEKTLVWEDNR